MIRIHENDHRLRKMDQQLKGLQLKQEEQSDAENPCKSRMVLSPL